MSWFKLLRYDLRFGLLRWRYLLIPLLFLLPCIACHTVVSEMESCGTWMDYMMYSFMGAKPVVYSADELEMTLPTFWLLAIGGCLFTNLDYLLHDLTRVGQQIIVRSGNRRGWYLAKCFWNLCSCIQYVLLAGISVLIFSLFFGAKMSLLNTPEITQAISYEELMEPIKLTVAQGLSAAVLMPMISLMAISMLQMTLCLLIKPVISFLVSMALLVAAVYCNSPLILGTGAMVIRSNILVANGISPIGAALVAVCIIFISVGVGCLFFKNTDILGLEE